ncbi:MAG: SCO family protein [Candidatus Kapabacteria bacterium]|nr:SCO family protein [Candidatus Kapabacteria bacterium]
MLVTIYSALSEKTPPEVGIEEQLGTTIPLNLKFVSSKGDTLSLKEIVDKPVILSFAYYHCPGICTPLLTGLSEAVDRMDMEPGKDYRLITISFDHSEGSAVAEKWRKTYAEGMKRKIPVDAWYFMTGDSISIKKLTSSVGYYFKPDGKEDFIHPAAIIALSSNGKVVRYLFGTKFLPFDLKMAVIEAQEGKVTPTINKVLSFCFSYDPQGRKYVLDVTKIAGAVSLFFVAIFLVILIFKGRKNKLNKKELS